MYFLYAEASKLWTKEIATAIHRIRSDAAKQYTSNIFVMPKVHGALHVHKVYELAWCVCFFAGVFVGDARFPFRCQCFSRSLFLRIFFGWYSTDSVLVFHLRATNFIYAQNGNLKDAQKTDTSKFAQQQQRCRWRRRRQRQATIKKICCEFYDM